MIEVREKTDLLELFKSKTIDGIAHQTNLEKKMGKGIALRISQTFPEALKALEGSCGSLGETSSAKTPSGVIWNATSQSLQGIGRRTNYEAFYRCFELISKQALEINPNFKLGIPYNIGCGLGGGSWIVISAMLADIFEDSTIRLIVCKYN